MTKKIDDIKENTEAKIALVEEVSKTQNGKKTKINGGIVAAGIGAAAVIGAGGFMAGMAVGGAKSVSEKPDAQSAHMQNNMPQPPQGGKFGQMPPGEEVKNAQNSTSENSQESSSSTKKSKKNSTSTQNSTTNSSTSES